MSDLLRIALVAEGPTDYEIIHAALRAILPRPFVMTLLQPEATRPEMGGGWCGVRKWCHDTRLRCTSVHGADITLTGFDLLVIHLDLDVAALSYADCGTEVESMARDWNWITLPCQQPCPPISATRDHIESALKSWLGGEVPMHRTQYCLPAQSSGTWLAAAILPSGHALLASVECDTSVEKGLAQLPKKERIKKSVLEYRKYAPDITTQWQKVKQICTQAERFEQTVLATL
ncbi:MAG: hypothetical protein WCL42_10055 [Chlorobiaceae bacterium]|jgi:hypothetical protein